MKWRWRRRVKVAPGVTVNLSPTSVGASVGGPAGRVSANTKGRVTAGQSLPGTGLYSQTTLASGAQPAKKQQQGGGCAVLAAAVMLLVGCGVIGLGATSMVRRPDLAPTAPARAVEPIPLDTPTPSTATPVVVETTVAVADSRTVLLPLVAGAADAVSVADTPLPTAVPTDTPLPTAIPTDTPWPTAVPTNTPVPTAVPTNTPWPTATPIPVVLPTEPPPPSYSWVRTIDGVVFGSDCPCDQGNTLNCGDFSESLDAQSCYMRCLEMSGDDVHELDRDTDGNACEWRR